MAMSRAVALVLCTAIVVLIVAGAFGMAYRHERVRATPDPYEPFRQTVQAMSRATPTLDAYDRGRARAQTMMAGLPTITPSAPGATLADIYRCADDYARGWGGALSVHCNAPGVDACVRGILREAAGGIPSFGCYGIAAGGRGVFASQYQIEDCVWAAFDDNSLSKWGCTD